MLLKGWAPLWKTTQSPTKVEYRAEYWAAFEDRLANLIRVHVTAKDLKGFGNPAKSKKREYKEQVLRAILECYINEKRQPPTKIDARDLQDTSRIETTISPVTHWPTCLTTHR